MIANKKPKANAAAVGYEMPDVASKNDGELAKTLIALAEKPTMQDLLKAIGSTADVMEALKGAGSSDEDETLKAESFLEEWSKQEAQPPAGDWTLHDWTYGQLLRHRAQPLEFALFLLILLKRIAEERLEDPGLGDPLFKFAWPLFVAGLQARLAGPLVNLMVPLPW